MVLMFSLGLNLTPKDNTALYPCTTLKQKELVTYINAKWTTKIATNSSPNYFPCKIISENTPVTSHFSVISAH